MGKIITGQAVDLHTMSQASASVGEVKSSLLNISDFNNENLGQWMLMDGQSCIGTAYHLVTGKSNTPNIVTNGEFLRQAKAGRDIGTLEVDDNKAHYHNQSDGYASGPYGVDNPSTHGTSFFNHGDGYIANSLRTSTVGGTETHPKNIAVNFYLKVGY